MAHQQYDPRWDYVYLAMGISFVLYCADFMWMVLGAVLCATSEWIRPPPGHPSAVRRWNRKKAQGKLKTPIPVSAKELKAKVSLDDEVDNSSPLSTTSLSSGVSKYHPRTSAATKIPSGTIGAKLDDYNDGVHESLVSLYNHYPLVLVQIPQYNEDAHCDSVVERCCTMAWPRNRVLFQVCDDSTDPEIKERVDAAVLKCQKAGHWVMLTRRTERKGYKAGNLLHGMQSVSTIPFNYVAVFDADFYPPRDYLYQTVYHMERNPGLGFVQARWSFLNPPSIVTWLQRCQLDLHFCFEQRGRSFFGQCFCFNGSGGIWSMNCYNDVGGWNTDTLVEDTDMACRAYVRGWKFKFLYWVECGSELCPTYAAFKSQQYRWSCGPMQVLVKVFPRVLREKGPFLSKVDVTYFMFRPLLSVACSISCLGLPFMAVWIAPWSWPWNYVHWMVFISSMYLVIPYTYISIFSFPYLMFCNCFAWFRIYAYMHGLLGVKKAASWKVTLKVGDGKNFKRVYHRPYTLELCGGLWNGAVFAASMWTISKKWHNPQNNQYQGMLVSAAYCGLFSIIFFGLSIGDYWMW